MDRVASVLEGRYAIRSVLGRGGQATVYLAADEKHRRDVAIKVLHPELAASVGRARFLREIEIVAGLSHPYILPLYDSGVSEDVFYYVMPYVRGETVRERIDREGPMDAAGALRIAGQVGSALAFAHERGVLHRDIKPGNVLLHEGSAMVTDFGIALPLGQGASLRQTETGLLVGTPAYMSPEQASGEPELDERTDVYGVACVLYEMLTGRLPFEATSPQALLTRKLMDRPPRIRQHRPEVPATVERLLILALEPRREDRLPSMAELTAGLTLGAPAPPKDEATVAVLPFVHLGPDPDGEYFADGITEDVIAHLARIRALRVTSRTSVMRFKGTELSLREIGEALEVSAILEGSVRRAGDRLRIVAQLVDVDADQHLWADVYDRRLTDIFDIQTEVALRIADALRTELSGAEKDRLHRAPTGSLEAYQLYLRGRSLYIGFTHESMKEAMDFFRAAIAKDPGYAMAHVGLALAFTELAESGTVEPANAYRQAAMAVETALSLDPDLGQAHTVFGHIRCLRSYDWDGAERSFLRAIELTPGGADAYNLYGRMCAAMGRHDEAIVLQRRAQELDPLTHRLDLATAYLRAGRYDEALDVAARARELDADEPRAIATYGWGLFLGGRQEEGLELLEQASATAPDETLWLSQLGEAYGLTGRTEEARAVLSRLHEMATSGYVSPYHLAYVHTGLGEADRAIDLLEQAFEERSAAIYGIKGAFLFATLREHPRFVALLRRMKLQG